LSLRKDSSLYITLDHLLIGVVEWLKLIICAIDRAWRFHKSEIRNPKSQILTRDVTGIETG